MKKAGLDGTANANAILGAQAIGGGGEEKIEKPVARQAETIRPEMTPEAQLRAKYNVPAETKRNGWTGSLDLARDDSPKVRTMDFASWWSVRDNSIINDVHELLGPRNEVEQRLRALGFVPEGQQSGDRMAYIKTSIDSEMARRIPFIAPKLRPHQTLGINAEVIKAADPADLGGFERYVQRVCVDYEGGRPRDAYLLTYGWPHAGDGMNEDNIHWSSKYPISHVLMNTTLEHSVAVPFSVNLKYAMERRREEGGE